MTFIEILLLLIPIFSFLISIGALITTILTRKNKTLFTIFLMLTLTFGTIFLVSCFLILLIACFFIIVIAGM